MKVTESEHIRKRVYSMLALRPKADVVKHFLNEGIPRSTIYSVIKRFEANLTFERKPKSGRPSKFNRVTLRKLKKAVVDKTGVSQNQLARKFKVSQSTICANVAKMGVKYRKRIKSPKYTKKQLDEIPKKCEELKKILKGRTKMLVIDDEKYFTFSNSSIVGNRGFYTENIQNTPDEVKYAGKKKFEEKVLVWMAISKIGFSDLFITSTKGFAVNADNYIQNCLPKLKKLIDSDPKNHVRIFWSDLASAHYAKKSIEWLEAENIRFVPNTLNPPTVPKARPIEDFCGILSSNV